MRRKALSDEIKARVTQDTRRRLERLVEVRQLDMSDLIREALRNYIEAQDAVARKNDKVAA